MADLRIPTAGGRIIIRPTTNGDHTARSLPPEDPLAGATDSEREYYLTHYQGIPLAELLRRLRTAEWDAAEYRRRSERASAQLAAMPPLHKIRDLNERHQRVQALLDVPRRRTIPVAEVREALHGSVED